MAIDVDRSGRASTTSGGGGLKPLVRRHACWNPTGRNASVNDAAVTTCPHRASTRPVRARSRPIEFLAHQMRVPIPAAGHSHPPRASVSAASPGPARRPTTPPLSARPWTEPKNASMPAPPSPLQSQVHVHPHSRSAPLRGPCVVPRSHPLRPVIGAATDPSTDWPPRRQRPPHAAPLRTDDPTPTRTAHQSTPTVQAHQLPSPAGSPGPENSGR